MNDLIKHRGPDDEGVYQHDHLGMGMRRLSVVDLSTGNQPMYNDARDTAIVFNGEIYNYKELKAGMEKDGIVFKTKSDTEVVLRLYEQYGSQMLSMLDGMFAFSIHNQQTSTLFLARDRFGEKPLYYFRDTEKFVWASELKSLICLFPELKQISADALRLFFSLTYIPAPHSIYENVFKVLPGHYLIVNTDTLEFESDSYWDIDTSPIGGEKIPYPEAMKQVRQLLSESVQQRMIADVPLGVFLSGGVDSTIVASVMARQTDQKINTFSVGYANKRYDESERARQVARHIGSLHHEYLLDSREILGRIDEILVNYDEPFADSSCLPTWFVSSRTAEHVKVALTGDGGDEVFGGYNKYDLPKYSRKFQQLVPRFARSLLVKTLGHLDHGDSKSVFSKMNKVAGLLTKELIPGHLSIISLGFRLEEMNQLFLQPIGHHQDLLYPLFKRLSPQADELKKMRYIDKQISLEGDLLVKVDRAAMLCSLECRAPFLDHKLLEYSYRLPDNYLIGKGSKKRILKDAFEDLLPTGFFNAPKSGFEVPIGQWLREELKGDLLVTLSPASLLKTGLFNLSYVNHLLTNHLNYKANHTRQLWTLYCFQKWYNRYMNNA